MLKIEIIGNIGNDAKIVQNNGAEFVSFSVAHSEKRNEKEITTWVNVTTQNTKLAQYLTKGTKVYVRGNATLRAYQNDQHQPVASFNVFATEIEFCGGKNNTIQPEQTTQHVAQIFPDKQPQAQQSTTPPPTIPQQSDMPF